MAEQPPVPTRLHELAVLLRQAHHLGPDMQKALADLVEELSGSLDPATLPETTRNHLAESTAQLADALHRQTDESGIAAARKRLEAAAVRLEAEAPLASGIVRRLIDALANLGV
jgi:hypothetical protein